jgi:hypothetical protein
MRSRNTLNSADPVVGRLLGCLSDRMQNIQFGKAQVRRLRDQVADHSGGYRVLCDSRTVTAG